MAKIETLVRDIRTRLRNKEPYPEETISKFAYNLALKLVDRLSREAQKPTLRMSNLGTPCDRKLWYSINRPDTAEPLSASARLKFLIGDVWEEVLLFLAASSGHTVEKQQQRVNLHGVEGHIDAVIDGELVDAKSASTPRFKKFNSHGLSQQDDFGYRVQLGTYLASLDADTDVNHDRAHFLVGDKTLGHITLDTHERKELCTDDYENLVAQKRKMLEWPTPPERGFSDVKDGESGNRKLGVSCSYCPFKRECWPGLQPYGYARGPVFLTRVVKEPRDPVRKLSWDEATED